MASATDGCIASAISLVVDGENALLEISTTGVLRSLGVSAERRTRMVLEVAGCTPGPELTDLSYATGLVSSVLFAGRSEDTGPGTEVVVETRQAVDYTAASGARSVRVRLEPYRAPATRPWPSPDAAGPATHPEPARRSMVKVLEPLPRSPTRDAEIPVERGLQDPEVIAERVRQWAQAWSEQRTEDYLAFYAASFRPVAGRSRAEWEARRRERVRRPSLIRVRLDDLQVRFEEGRAVAGFWQSYVSEAFSDLVYKRLTWIGEDGQWKIFEERVVASPALVAPMRPTIDPPGSSQ